MKENIGNSKTTNERMEQISKQLKQLKTENEVLRSDIIKYDERNKDSALKLAQVSLVSSNTNTQIEDIRKMINKNETEQELNLKMLKDEIKKKMPKNGCIQELEDKVSQIFSLTKKNENDLNIYKNLVKTNDAKQMKVPTTDGTEENEDVANKLQKLDEKFKNQFEHLLSKQKKMEDIYKAQMTVVTNEASDERANRETIFNLEKSLSHASKQFSEVSGQIQTIFARNSDNEGTLSQIETGLKDLNNKLSDLESADVFLQEANRQLVENVSKISDTLRNEEHLENKEIFDNLGNKLQQTELSVLNLSGEMQRIHIDNKRFMDSLEKLEKQTMAITENKKSCEFLRNELLNISSNIEATEQNLQEMKLKKTDVHLGKIEIDKALIQFETYKLDIKSIIDAMKKGQEDVQKKIFDQAKELKCFHDQNLLNIQNIEREHLEQIKKLSEDRQNHEVPSITKDTNQCKPVKDKSVACNDIWRVVQEINAVLRGSVLVVRSEGPVSDSQGDVLGVYRLVDSYSDRPLYKQDGGENYLYYSSQSRYWMVGTVVGHPYGWLRNLCPHGKWVSELTSGWEYRSSSYLTDQTIWMSDDETLRIEALPDMNRIHNLIKKIESTT